MVGAWSMVEAWSMMASLLRCGRGSKMASLLRCGWRGGMVVEWLFDQNKERQKKNGYLKITAL